MLSYALRRLLGAIPTLLILLTLAFVMMRAAPGGPFDADRELPPQVRANLEAKYHLDEPLYQQYGRYIWDIAHFDFGPEREEYERHWTPEAYDAMTEIMASLPNHWRFFVKARIFDAMNASETGGADVVRSAFTSIKAEHPQIAAE